jgi:hypothetical protein
VPTLVQDVKWGEDNALDAAPVLSEEEQDILKKRMLAMDKILATQKIAKYKIELFFSHRRTGRAPTPGAISLWESGAKLHGGGDCKIYLCPSKAQKMGDCNGIIPDAAQGYGHLVCPNCKKVWKGSQVHGEIFARLTTQDWARLLYKYFVRLGHNCDIYVKVPKVDIRKAAALEQARQLRGEKLTVARTKRDVYIYPLRNIIKEVNAGADVLGRFRALLSA